MDTEPSVGIVDSGSDDLETTSLAGLMDGFGGASAGGTLTIFEAFVSFGEGFTGPVKKFK